VFWGGGEGAHKSPRTRFLKREPLRISVGAVIGGERWERGKREDFQGGGPQSKEGEKNGSISDYVGGLRGEGSSRGQSGRLYVHRQEKRTKN